MPPAKKTQAEDATAAGRERPSTAAGPSRKARNGAAGNAAQPSGSALKQIALTTTESGSVVVPGQLAPGTGMAWQTAPLELLDAYRVTHSLAVPAAFTSPLNHALLTNPGIGRQSPTMARKKDKRRTSKEQLALAVRKNFNGAAVNEIDVVVDLMYKVRNHGKAFRMRSTPIAPKKPSS